jgi:Flp pilus assembly protein TadG
MANRVTARRWASERGAEVIEFALVLPLLLLIIFGLVDFGFLFQRYLVLTNAAMEGARVAVLPGYGQADAITRATSYAANSGIPNTSSSCTPEFCVTATPTTVPGAITGSTFPAWVVTVSFRHYYSYMGPVAEMFGGAFSSVTLTARATMRSYTGTTTGGGS